MGFPLGNKVLLANFLELRQGEVRRIPLPRTRVNKEGFRSVQKRGLRCFAHPSPLAP